MAYEPAVNKQILPLSALALVKNGGALSVAEGPSKALSRAESPMSDAAVMKEQFQQQQTPHGSEWTCLL